MAMADEEEEEEGSVLDSSIVQEPFSEMSHEVADKTITDHEADAIAFSTLHNIIGNVSLSSDGAKEPKEEKDEAEAAAQAAMLLLTFSFNDPGSDLLAQCDLQHVPAIPSADFKLPLRAETWPADDVRRHWLLRNHCEWLLIPLVYPTLDMPTALGAYYWRKHTNDARLTPRFLSEELRCVSGGLRDLALYAPQPEQLLWSQQLMASTDLSSATRKGALRLFGRFLTAQRGLIMVSLENARLEVWEAMPLLRDLGAAVGGRLRRLYLWHAFRRHLYPIALRKRAGKRDPCASGVWRRGPTRRAPAGPALLPLTRALPLFSALTVLAVNYCDVADPCGETLLTLASLRAGVLRQLHLLVLEQELPRRSQGAPSLGAVPDWTWRRARALCPLLRVYLVLCACPTYDMVSSVWSRSLPLAQLHMSSGVDSRFRQPWLVDCVFREMRIWFTDTIRYLTLHLWRNRDLLDADLLRSLQDFPKLQHLEFIGCFENIKTISKMCDSIVKDYCGGCTEGCPRMPLRRLVLRPQLGPKDDDAKRLLVRQYMNVYEPLLGQMDIYFDCTPFPV